MNKIKAFIKDELSGWKKWQIFWMIFANAMILGISIYQKDTVLGISASITGVICVILCGMGKVSNYIFGTVNTILYAIAAWKARYYGEVMLNLLYYLPTNTIGWFAWRKNINQEKKQVYMRRMTRKQLILLFVISIAGILGYSLILKLMDGNLPLIDSMSTVLSVIAQVLLIKRFTEQWLIWIIVDFVSVAMWVAALFTEAQSIAVLLMWCVYLANAMIMYFIWLKESKHQVAGRKVVE